MLPKMIWEIEQIFARTLESVKIGTLMGTFCTKLKMYEIKIYRGVMCHDKEERCKNWRGTDLSIQNWHEEFDQFWHEHLKISNIFTLMDWFWPKYIMFELKKYRGVMFDGTEVWCKTWRKSSLCFQIWHEKLSQFWPEHLKVSKIRTLFVQSWKCMSFFREVMCHDNEEWCKNWREIELSFQNWHEEFDQFWSEHSKISNIFTLMDCFWPKYIMFELKNTEELCLMTLKIDAKLEEKLICGFKNDIKILANFSSEADK